MTVGSKLKVSYIYTDAEKEKEGTTIIKWYRADNAKGDKKEAIKGATKNSYTLTVKDEGKYINVEIDPVAASGTLKGAKITIFSKKPVTLPEDKYTTYVKLGLIGSKSYAEK